MTLRVTLAVPEGEVWSGRAQMVIAKTLDGDIGVLTGRAPVLGILAEGSLVRIFAQQGADPSEPGADQTAGQQQAAGQEELSAAVAGGFFAVADDRVSILARQAQLGADVDRRAVQAELEAEDEAAAGGQGDEEAGKASYLRALLRAAGDVG